MLKTLHLDLPPFGQDTKTGPCQLPDGVQQSQLLFSGEQLYTKILRWSSWESNRLLHTSRNFKKGKGTSALFSGSANLSVICSTQIAHRESLGMGLHLYWLKHSLTITSLTSQSFCKLSWLMNQLL